LRPGFVARYWQSLDCQTGSRLVQTQ
jgi:hypothetical protein